MPHRYRVFGLNLLSEIEFPNLPILENEASAQVWIRSGILPEDLPGAKASKRYFQASQGKLLVRVKDLGRFLVEDGQRITFETGEDFAPANLRLALINLGLSVILHQRGALALHASAVATPGGAVLFCGERSAGKSTLAAGLRQRGWPLVCDDKAALYLGENQRVTVIPSFPELRLWKDAMQQLEISAEHAEKNPDSDKFNLGLADGFHLEPLPLRAIYHLKPVSANQISIQAINGMEKFQVVKQNTYTNQFLKGLELLSNYFSLASAVAAKIPVYRVNRPSQTNQLEALIDQIDAELRNG